MKKLFLILSLLSGVLLCAQDSDTQLNWMFSSKESLIDSPFNYNSIPLDDFKKGNYKESNWYKRNHAYDDLSKGKYGVLYVCNVARNDDREHGDCFNTYFMLLSKKYGFKLEWSSSNILDMELSYEMIMDSAIKADFGANFFANVRSEVDSLEKINKGFNRPQYLGDINSLKTIINLYEKHLKGGGFNYIDFKVDENGIGTPSHLGRAHLEITLPHIQLALFTPATLMGNPFKYNCRIWLD